MKNSKIKLILKDNWLGFLKLYGKKVRKNVKREVEKVLACGDISKGYIEFRCDSCMESKKVGFSCKSRFCTSCGKVYTDIFASSHCARDSAFTAARFALSTSCCALVLSFISLNAFLKNALIPMVTISFTVVFVL